MLANPEKSGELLSRLDRLPFSKWHRAFFIVAFLGIMFDAADFALFGAALPPISREFTLGPAGGLSRDDRSRGGVRRRAVLGHTFRLHRTSRCLPSHRRHLSLLIIPNFGWRGWDAIPRHKCWSLHKRPD
jgi:hypothetical protein